MLFWLWDSTAPFSTADYKLPRERADKRARCWDKLFSLQQLATLIILAVGWSAISDKEHSHLNKVKYQMVDEYNLDSLKMPFGETMKFLVRTEYDTTQLISFVRFFANKQTPALKEIPLDFN
jgi:hypothetical protein